MVKSRRRAWRKREGKDREIALGLTRTGLRSRGSNYCDADFVTLTTPGLSALDPSTRLIKVP